MAGDGSDLRKRMFMAMIGSLAEEEWHRTMTRVDGEAAGPGNAGNGSLGDEMAKRMQKGIFEMMQGPRIPEGVAFDFRLSAGMSGVVPTAGASAPRSATLCSPRPGSLRQADWSDEKCRRFANGWGT